MRTIQTYLGLSLLLLVWSCRPENVGTTDIPDIVQPYIDLFEQEAAARGQDIVVDNLIVSFEENLQSGAGADAAGLCTFQSNTNATPMIELDSTSANWQNSLPERETLIFHELGHCILNRRQHRDDLLPNGNAVSLMNSKAEQLYAGELTSFKRAYYLDELFDPTTPAPAWGAAPPDFGQTLNATVVYNDEFLFNTGWPTGTNDERSAVISNGLYTLESKSTTTAWFFPREIEELDRAADFEIEVSIRIDKGDGAAMLQWGGTDEDNVFFMGVTGNQAVFAGKWPTGIDLLKVADDYKEGDFNIVTIRKQGEFMYFYLNEVFYDVFQAPDELPGNFYAFYVGPETAYTVEYLSLKEIQ